MFASGMLMSGCVFFICTLAVGLAGGSGKMVMRAVSFFGADEGAGGGVTGSIGWMAAAAAWRTPGGLGENDALVPGTAGALDPAGGGINGGGLTGRWAGVAAAGSDPGGRRGTEGDAPGGRAGKLIRTVSRPEVLPAGAGCAGPGTAIRTVSFFGSFCSAMIFPIPKNLPETNGVVTGEVGPPTGAQRILSARPQVRPPNRTRGHRLPFFERILRVPLVPKE